MYQPLFVLTEQLNNSSGSPLWARRPILYTLDEKKILKTCTEALAWVRGRYLDNDGVLTLTSDQIDQIQGRAEYTRNIELAFPLHNGYVYKINIHITELEKVTITS